jgi:serpin B
MEIKTKNNFLLVVINIIFIPTCIYATGDSGDDPNAISDGINKFAFNLYTVIKDSPAAKQAEGNIFFSPYSISTALGMTYTGARGNTAKEMADVLGLPSFGIEGIATGYSSLQKNMQGDAQVSGYELNIANAIWTQVNNNEINSSFIKLIWRFGGECKALDFANQIEQTRQTINKWTEKQTKDKIKELIPKGMIDPVNTELILTNAIYFKGPWVTPFVEPYTRPAKFNVTENKTVEVPMMLQKASQNVGYAQTDDAQILQLPYGPDDNAIGKMLTNSLNKMESVKKLRSQISRGDSASQKVLIEINDEQRQKIQNQTRRLSMLIILPKTIGDLDSVESKFNPQTLQTYINQIKQEEVVVYVPKFKMAGGTIELKKILSAMGMKEAFISGSADFSGMNGKKDLFIYTVLHKAYIDVNEKGTEASAATDLLGAPGGMSSNPPVFRADRPFIFLIRDNITGSILFMGRVLNPMAQGE